MSSEGFWSCLPAQHHPHLDMNRDVLRILNLEADASAHEMIKRHACAAGPSYRIEQARGRAEFETALKRGDVDLVLADPNIPGFDGAAAMESARAVLPGVPFVLVSGPIGEERTAALMSLGAAGFVAKGRLEGLPEAIKKAAQDSHKGRLRLEVEERFRLMAENIREVFWICSADGSRVLYVSPAFDAIWGASPAEMLAGKSGWADSVIPDDREAFLAARSKLAAGSRYNLEYRIQRPDSTIRWIHDRGYPAGESGSGTARMVGVAADVTERKHLEEDLLQAQKLEFVGKLAGGIAHEFNNLLTIISGYVSMLLDKESLPPGSSESLRRVFTASRQATRLVHQLLLFSRKRAIRREAIDLNGEVEQMVAALRRLLGEMIVVSFEPSPDSPRISADAGMLEQVLMNLAINARDAMPKGGSLRIQVGTRRRETGGPSQAFVSVADTGTGIAPAILPRIFEPFFTTKEEGRGTGLGLATAQDIVKRHDGSIEVETAMGAGSTFRIWLPLTSAEVLPTAGAAAREGPKEGKATILLVEDEATVREFAAAVLQQDGHTVIQASSGENALESWQWHSSRIDLLLSDVVLPGDFSGTQLGAMLQDQKPSLKVILSTGYSREIVETSATGGSPPVILSKPYTPRTLLRSVHEALR
jgi:PAS domain S-box-containing protein